jgi:formylglycine-generating enzyme required for sulfatase activity
MMAVPIGTFTMGSPATEHGRFDDEGPQHRVTINSQFAIGQFALTFDEWDACAADGDCDRYRSSDQGWGRGRRPVIGVSWDDAKAYIAWLSRKTGKTYRLLSEPNTNMQRAPARRHDGTTAYPWRDDIGRDNANCKACASQWLYQTAPVGSFAPNRFGLYDMVGNVWAWTEDCYHDSYSGAPTDGSAWTSGVAVWCVAAPGKAIPRTSALRSAAGAPDYRSSDNGIRLGRTLTPKFL